MTTTSFGVMIGGSDWTLQFADVDFNNDPGVRRRPRFHRLLYRDRIVLIANDPSLANVMQGVMDAADEVLAREKPRKGGKR